MSAWHGLQLMSAWRGLQLTTATAAVDHFIADLPYLDFVDLILAKFSSYSF